MIPPQIRSGGYRMDEFERLPTEMDPTIADVFEELAKRGKFDETGSELSEDDWADSQ